MGYEEECDALRLQAVEHLEQAMHFVPGDGRRRLVHDDDVGVDRERLGNLHRLPFGHAQHLDGKAHVDRHVQNGQQLACLLLHGRPVDSPGPQRLAPDEHVLRDGKVREQDRMLMNDRNAASLGVDRAVDDGLVTVDEDRAVVRGIDPGQDLDQGALAGAVLAREGVDAARFEGELDVAQHLHGTEALRYSA